MIDQILRSATFGFGASAGRDLYRSAKKNPIIYLIIGIFLVTFGWRNYYLGFGRSKMYRIFITYIGSTLMVLIGSIIILAIGLIFSSNDEIWPIFVAAGVIFVSVIIGNFWGISSRHSRITAMETLIYNQKFLADIGLTDSDFEKDMLQDQAGNLLKLKEQNDEKIVFTVAGKRGLRSAIKLENGRMVDYTGIVKI